MRLRQPQSDAVGQSNRPPTLDVQAESAVSLGDIAKMLGRHKWFIVACVAAGVAIASTYLHYATPIYQAVASIRIDPNRVGSLGLADLTSGGSDSGLQIATEIAVIKSDAVALDTLHSLSDDEFREYTHADRKTLGILPGATSLTPAQEGMLGAFKSQINVVQVPDTQLVSITLRNPNPRVAAYLLNSLVQAYLRQNFDSRYGSVAQVSTWLSTEMTSLKQRAADAQDKLATFEEQNHILAFGGSTGGTSSGKSGGSGSGGGGAVTTTITDRLTSLQARLTDAQATRILKEAQMTAAATGDIAVIAALYPSASMTELQAQQSTLYGQYVQLSTKFGPNYPPLAQVKAEMQKTDAELNHQVTSIRSRLKQELDTASNVEHSLQQQVDEQTQEAYALNRKAAQLAVLLAEGSSSRELYDTLQYKLKQASVDAGLNNVNTMIVDTARAPLVPIEPKKIVILSFGLVLGLFAGVGSVFLREATSDKVQNVIDIERILGYHLLAAVPHFDQKVLAAKEGGAPSGIRVGPMLITYRNTLSGASEAFRTLRNSILLSSIDKPAKTVMVSSSIPSEGKSSVTANYAVVLAQKGSRVLLVDADIRRPTQHIQFGIPNAAGLTSLILDDTAMPSFHTPIPELPNLTVLTAGQKVPLPSEALGSTRFHTLISSWEQDFDYVIIDSAPLLIVSDSLPLASWVDSLILVARYNFTPNSALKRIRDILRHADAHVAGVVLNDLSTGDSAYYGGYGNDYYNK